MSEAQQIALRDEPSGALTPLEVLNNAVARGASVEVLERLMGLQERWEANQARKAFDDAMSEAKAEIPVIVKNRRVGFDSKKAGAARTDYRHEDLAEIARTVDPILAKHGLSYRFRTSSVPQEPVSVTCIVSHRLGHSEENTLQGPRDETGNKNSIQSIGSTITYLQRYTLKAALGLAAAADDDGERSEQVGPISEEQVANIRKIIEETGAIIEKVCEYMGVASIPEIEEADYQKCIDALEEWRRKSAARQKQQPKRQTGNEEIPF